MASHAVDRATAEAAALQFTQTLGHPPTLPEWRAWPARPCDWRTFQRLLRAPTWSAVRRTLACAAHVPASPTLAAWRQRSIPWERLTPAQRRVCAAAQTAPDIATLAATLGLAPATVHKHLWYAARRGAPRPPTPRSRGRVA